MVCHDLRAPLAAVTMGAGFVLQVTRDDERTQRVLEAMLRSCAQMERLIKMFADLSEVESESVALDLGSHDARAVVDFVADGVSVEKDIAITVSTPDEPLVVRCDAERLKRMLAHLVDNAVRHSPEGSEIVVGVERRDPHVEFFVRDHGPGLTPETAEHLFDREWHRQQPNRQGAGFGLYITRGLARAHGGDVRFTREDDTTTFVLRLPL